MTKLTDTQSTILAAAGARDTGLVLPFPKSLKQSVAKVASTVQSMIKSGLILERPAADGETTWRTDDGIGKLTIAITAQGLRAIGIEPTSGTNDGASDDKRRNTTDQVRTRRATSTPSRAKGSDRTVKAPSAKLAMSTRRPTTKLDLLIGALRSKKGATIEDLTNSTGWQAHSVRGAISGALKKKQGLNIVSAVVDGRGRVYRIAE